MSERERENAVERVARSIWEAENRLHPEWDRPPWDSEIDMPARDEYRTVARAALEAVGAGSVLAEAASALEGCIESLEGISREWGGDGGFKPWSHPAVSLRMARQALARLRALRPAPEEGPTTAGLSGHVVIPKRYTAPEGDGT